MLVQTVGPFRGKPHGTPFFVLDTGHPGCLASAPGFPAVRAKPNLVDIAGQLAWLVQSSFVAPVLLLYAYIIAKWELLVNREKCGFFATKSSNKKYYF